MKYEYLIDAINNVLEHSESIDIDQGMEEKLSQLESSHGAFINEIDNEESQSAMSTKTNINNKMKYIVIGIRYNPCKIDYVWAHKDTNSQAVSYDTREEAEAEADRVNNDSSLSIYSAVAVAI
jgi:hypothetical protein